MRRPCLPCLPALLLFLAISGMTPCIQVLDGQRHPAPEQQLLSADALFPLPAAMPFDRGARPLSDSCLLSAVVTWPCAAYRDSFCPLRCDSALPHRTDFRGLLPLPASPPYISSHPEAAAS